MKRSFSPSIALCLCNSLRSTAFSEFRRTNTTSEARVWARRSPSPAVRDTEPSSPGSPCTTAQTSTSSGGPRLSGPAAGQQSIFPMQGDGLISTKAALWARDRACSGEALPNAPATRAQTVTYLWRRQPGRSRRRKAWPAGEGETPGLRRPGGHPGQRVFQLYKPGRGPDRPAKVVPAGEGTALLAVDVTVENVHTGQYHVRTTDFQLQWGNRTRATPRPPPLRRSRDGPRE